uniref:Uncharacterized protein n=1 Tax=Zea mays TaxID=4577 RepID=C0PKU5_MAIZE|nr:unknown [Zea mays]
MLPLRLGSNLRVATSDAGNDSHDTHEPILTGHLPPPRHCTEQCNHGPEVRRSGTSFGDEPASSAPRERDAPCASPANSSAAAGPPLTHTARCSDRTPWPRRSSHPTVRGARR